MTNQANFNGTKLAKTVHPLPPLAEQKRIVAKVDELLAHCDALEEQIIAEQQTARRHLEAVVHSLAN